MQSIVILYCKKKKIPLHLSPFYVFVSHFYAGFGDELKLVSDSCTRVEVWPHICVKDWYGFVCV